MELKSLPSNKGKKSFCRLKDRIFGRTVCDDIYLPGDSTKFLAKAGDTLNILQAEAIDDSGIETIRIRSVLTCETSAVFAANAMASTLPTAASQHG